MEFIGISIKTGYPVSKHNNFNNNVSIQTTNAIKTWRKIHSKFDWNQSIKHNKNNEKFTNNLIEIAQLKQWEENCKNRKYLVEGMSWVLNNDFSFVMAESQHILQN